MAVADPQHAVVQVLGVGVEGLCPRAVRRTTAKRTSSSGSSMIAIGTSSGRIVAATGLSLTWLGLTAPVVLIVAAARSSPSRSAPLSPMKSRAGKKLCGRNPRQHPSIAAEMKVAELKTFGGLYEAEMR